MERLNGIEKQNKINILKMMFPELKQIDTESRLLYSYPFEGMIKIVDEGANEILEIDPTIQRLCGRYIIMKQNECKVSDENTDSTLVINLETNQGIIIKEKFWGCEHIDGILILDAGACNYIINSKLNILFRSKRYREIEYKYSDNRSHRFLVRGYRSEYRLRVNKKTEVLEAYDDIELENNYSLVGTEVKKEYEHKEAVRADRNEEVKYKLAFNGTIISDNSYCDIIKNTDIQNSPYFYCINTYMVGAKIGVLNHKGKEVIPPIYKNIQHLNNGIFMVDINNKRKIINTTSGYESEQIEEALCYIPNGIPIIMFVENSEWFIYDALGRKYKAVEIINYFKCKYNSQQPNYIQIDVNLQSEIPIYRYITRNFEAVTDFKIINVLKTLEWN